MKIGNEKLPVVLISCRSPLFTIGLRWLIGTSDPLILPVALDHPECLLEDPEVPPGTCLLLDVDMPSVRRNPALMDLCGTLGQFRVIALSDDVSDEQQELFFNLGAVQFLSKSVDPQYLLQVLVDLCHNTQEPRTARPARSNRSALLQLSPRQIQIARLISSGLLNKQIASQLGIAENTVKVHIRAMMNKLKVRNRTQIAALIVGARTQPATAGTPDHLGNKH